MARITIIHPTDLRSPKVGGIQTFIKGFIQYAPDDLDIEVIGTTVDDALRPRGIIQSDQFGRKTFRRVAVLRESNQNSKARIPLSLKFSLALKTFHYPYSERLLFFHRIEPAFFFRDNRYRKIGVVHTDVPRHIWSGLSETSWRRVPVVYRWLEKSTVPSFKRLYTVSQNTLEYLRQNYPGMRDRMEFLPTYVDPHVFCPSDEPRISVRGRLLGRKVSEEFIGGKWVLFVGRLQDQKAPLRLAEVLAEVRRRDTAVRLVIVGEGNLGPALKSRMGELGLSEHVHFAGAQTQDRLPEYYRASDALLLTSHYEGMPMAALEALACGIPCVSTRAGEVGRVIRPGSSGEIVNDYTPETMAEALLQVLARQGKYGTLPCVESISAFTPEKVLKPVYERVRSLESTSRGAA